jgi:plastocyanin
MRKPTLILTAILASLALVAAGCGGDDNNNNSSSSDSSGAQGNGGSTSEPTGGGGGGGAASKLTVTADPGGALKFDKSSLSAKAGKVTVTMDNPSSTPHALNIEGNGIEEKGTKTLTQGKASVTVNLKAGKYEFYCPVDGHKAAGMEGTLTVN